MSAKVGAFARKPHRRTADRGSWIAAGITGCAAAVVLVFWLGWDGLALAQSYAVDPKRVVDGDTFYVSVRVLEVDTPEVGGNARCEKERAWGERASRRTSELLRDSLVTLQIQGVDRHDRLLAKVILPDGRDLAQVLIAENLAKSYAGGPKPDWCD